MDCYYKNNIDNYINIDILITMQYIEVDSNCPRVSNREEHCLYPLKNERDLFIGCVLYSLFIGCVLFSVDIFL